jgi:hypothetical protein
VRWSPIFSRTTAARIAAARCGSSAKTFPKAKALAHCDITAEKQISPWRKDPALMAFLKAI